MSSSNRFSLAALANSSSINEQYEKKAAENNRKKELAEKVMNAKGLTPEEKQEIYFYLTDNKPQLKKKGSPPKNLRNITFAIDYLETRYSNKWRGIDCIAHRNGIFSNDHTTVYKALNKGLQLLEYSVNFAEQSLNKVLNKHEESSPMYQAISEAMEPLTLEIRYKSTLLELHRLVKEEEKRTGKKWDRLNSLEKNSP